MNTSTKKTQSQIHRNLKTPVSFLLAGSMMYCSPAQQNMTARQETEVTQNQSDNNAATNLDNDTVTATEEIHIFLPDESTEALNLTATDPATGEEEKKEGMGTGAKVAIGVAVVAAVIGVAYFGKKAFAKNELGKNADSPNKLDTDEVNGRINDLETKNIGLEEALARKNAAPGADAGGVPAVAALKKGDISEDSVYLKTFSADSVTHARNPRGQKTDITTIYSEVEARITTNLNQPAAGAGAVVVDIVSDLRANFNAKKASIDADFNTKIAEASTKSPDAQAKLRFEAHQEKLNRIYGLDQEIQFIIASRKPKPALDTFLASTKQTRYLAIDADGQAVLAGRNFIFNKISKDTNLSSVFGELSSKPGIKIKAFAAIDLNEGDNALTKEFNAIMKKYDDKAKPGENWNPTTKNGKDYYKYDLPNGKGSIEFTGDELIQFKTFQTRSKTAGEPSILTIEIKAPTVAK